MKPTYKPRIPMPKAPAGDLGFLDLLDMAEGPAWEDCCNHGEACYICTFKLMNRIKDIEAGKPMFRLYDLYLFPNEFFGTEVCIRYGNKGNEYISPGGLGDFLNIAGMHWDKMPEYTKASTILRNFGQFEWKLRKKKT